MNENYYLLMFKVKNFKGFKDWIEFDLRGNDFDLSDPWKNCPEINTIVTGDNGSGKSNLLEALGNLFTYIYNGPSGYPEPISNSSSKNEVISFEYTFISINSRIMTFKFDKRSGSNEIFNESILVDNKVITRENNEALFNEYLETLRNNIKVEYLNLSDLSTFFKFTSKLNYIINNNLFNDLIEFFNKMNMNFRYTQEDIQNSYFEEIYLSTSEKCLIIIFFALYILKNKYGYIILLDNIDILYGKLKDDILYELIKENNGMNQLILSSLEKTDRFFKKRKYFHKRISKCSIIENI